MRSTGGYPKVRDLQKLLRPRLNLAKINAILRYLEKSKRLEIDLGGISFGFARKISLVMSLVSRKLLIFPKSFLNTFPAPSNPILV
jgi:hypothetical protein